MTMTAVDERRSLSASRRIPFWDTTRYVAITLVVVGHAIEKQRGSALMEALYITIYAFHMPLFAFVSGRFASAGPGKPGSAGRLINQLVLPYVIFSVIWFVLRSVVEGDVGFNLVSPFWHLWFLVALAVWRLLLPALASLRHPLAVSVLVSCVAGYMSGVGGPTFDSGRIFGMLPFFVLGWVLQERGLPEWATAPWWSSRAPKVLAALLLFGAFLLCYRWADRMNEWNVRAWTQMSGNYDALQVSEWWAGFVRLGLLGIAVVLGASALLLMPRTDGLLARWGANTMYVYLLHGFLLYLLREYTDVFAWFDSAPRFLLLIALAVGWSTLLSAPAIRTVFRPLVEPRAAWLFRPQTPQVAPAGPLQERAMGHAPRR